MADSDVFEVITLFEYAERFVALPPGQIDLYDTPYALFSTSGSRGKLVNSIMGTFPNPFTTTKNNGCLPPGSFTGRAL